MSQGKTITEAMALACADMYTDNATVLISEKYPESFFALRTTRPLLAIMKDGETYMTTCRFGFPEELADDAFYLPLRYACRLSTQGIQITADKLEAEPVAEMSPYTYAEAYRHFEKLLCSSKAPLHFDILEEESRSMPHLWEGNHTCIQHARLVFDLLWQFEKEGRLVRELRDQHIKSGVRRRWYFSLKD